MFYCVYLCVDNMTSLVRLHPVKICKNGIVQDMTTCSEINITNHNMRWYDSPWYVIMWITQKCCSQSSYESYVCYPKFLQVMVMRTNSFKPCSVTARPQKHLETSGSNPWKSMSSCGSFQFWMETLNYKSIMRYEIWQWFFFLLSGRFSTSAPKDPPNVTSSMGKSLGSSPSASMAQFFPKQCSHTWGSYGKSW